MSSLPNCFHFFFAPLIVNSIQFALISRKSLDTIPVIPNCPRASFSFLRRWRSNKLSRAVHTLDVRPDENGFNGHCVIISGVAFIAKVVPTWKEDGRTKTSIVELTYCLTVIKHTTRSKTIKIINQTDSAPFPRTGALKISNLFTPNPFYLIYCNEILRPLHVKRSARGCWCERILRF
jgi:hypothetical protein